MTLLMMGSAEALPEEPAVRPMFAEDMTEEQLASAVSKLTIFKLILKWAFKIFGRLLMSAQTWPSYIFRL